MEGAVLSANEIVIARAEGAIYIDPYDEKHVQPCSYDVTLGPNYFVETPPDSKWPIGVHDTRFPVKLWGEPKIANKIRDTVIEPGQLMLTHTVEFIGGVKGITTMIKTKSTYARIGLDFVASGGWGDVGYVNRWTMVLKNISNHRIVVPFGEPVAQIVFMRTGGGKGYEGKYQDLAKDWTPAMMLPRARKEEKA